MSNIKEFSAFTLKPKRKKFTACNHTTVIAREKTRDIECDICGEVVDAFTFIFNWANKQQRIVWRSQSLDRTIPAREKQLDDLERKIRNAKQRLKRLNKKESK